MEQTKTAILVISHKPYWLPEEPAYLPVWVGKEAPPDNRWRRDNEGENIADKNATFCELTGLYWAWKNVKAEIYGLCHYRRYMGSLLSPLSRMLKKKEEQILTEPQIEVILRGYDVILPRKRQYWIETRESQYAHAHHIEDLQCVEGILAERYPEYLPDWKWMLGTRSGHICNMFIMRREQLDAYCTWLFDILFEAEKRLDLSSYNDNDRRAFGFLGERLLDVWIRRNGLETLEVPMINLEKQHWLRKGTAFVKRKVTRDKKGSV